MPDLSESLQGRDLGFLRIVAQLWGLELQAPDARLALLKLVPWMLEPELVEEIVIDLPETARQALADLINHEGRLPWAMFSRRYGSLREMGAGRRDRERPYQNSPSPAEMLWYRALVGRAFFDTPSGPEEYAFIPDDLFILLPEAPMEASQPLGRLASPLEKSVLLPATDFILDDACTLLAALRIGMPVDPLEAPAGRHFSTEDAAPLEVLKSLLASAGILDLNHQILPEPTRSFLEANRGDALALLVGAWLRSEGFNELRFVPGLRVEGETKNDPLRARQAVLDFLSQVPVGSWWSLAAFVSAIGQRQPDFQRPAGDYDSWFIRDTVTGEYLRGFEHWHDVDGALLRYMLCGPMHWLGLIDLAAAAEDSRGTSTAFRLSKWATDLLAGNVPPDFEREEAPIFARSKGTVHVSRLTPRPARYQVARFCHWDRYDGENYRYRITTSSLLNARSQGLRVSHLLAIFRKYAKNVPPALVTALERWEENGTEAHLERLLILRLSNPEILQALRNSPAARYLGDPLGTAAIVVKPGALEKVLAALAEMGYLAEVESGLLDS